MPVSGAAPSGPSRPPWRAGQGPLRAQHGPVCPSWSSKAHPSRPVPTPSTPSSPSPQGRQEPHLLCPLPSFAGGRGRRGRDGQWGRGEHRETWRVRHTETETGTLARLCPGLFPGDTDSAAARSPWAAPAAGSQVHGHPSGGGSLSRGRRASSLQPWMSAAPLPRMTATRAPAAPQPLFLPLPLPAPVGAAIA